MTNRTLVNRGGWWRTGVLAAVLGLGVLPSKARANDNLNYHGGPTRNLVLDVVFWGSTISSNDRADVKEYIVNFAKYMNGGFNPPGSEPAVRFYNLWSIVPGNWIVDPNPTGDVYGSGGGLTNLTFEEEIDAAQSGMLGPSQDFAGNVWSGGLPRGQDRLAIVIVKGGNLLEDDSCQNTFNHGCIDQGFHDYNSGHDYPYAGVSFDYPPGTVGFPQTLSHEVLESMTDTQPFIGWGWATDEDLGTSHAEAADSCGGDWSLHWTASTGHDISGISKITLDAGYGGLNSIPGDTCQLWEPQQYTPMAAAFEASDGGGGPALTLVYRTPAGRLNEISWLSAGQSASAPADIGQPASNVTAEGKPTIVYSIPSGGESVFVRGSDNALWMRRGGSWTSLGGVLFGDPSAVIWNNGMNVNVFALGTDAHIWTYGLWNMTPLPWGQIPGGNLNFNSPPKAFSRNATTIDIFAVAENGALQQISYSSSTGWVGPQNHAWILSGSNGWGGFPYHSPISIASWGSDRLDIFGTGMTVVGHRGWGGSWSAYDIRNELGTTPSGTPGVVSWGTNRIDAFEIDRSNRLLHVVWNGAWVNDPLNPMRTDAVGDPIVMSRGSGQLDVVYRTGTGSLTHLSYNSGSSWLTEASILPAGSVQ